MELYKALCSKVVLMILAGSSFVKHSDLQEFFLFLCLLEVNSWCHNRLGIGTASF